MIRRSMQAIPISTAHQVAYRYGYDQVVILARKVGDAGGEHVTTYGVDPTHCGVAALMGDTLKRIAQWPDLTFANFICAIRDRFKGQAGLTDVEATVHALAALDSWEDAGEPVVLTKECAEAIADTELEHWEAD